MTADRLLVLDDDQAVAATIGFIAEQSGSEVRVTHSPDTFFSQLPSFRPTCVLLDLVMPGMDGVEVLRGLAACGFSSDIILTSGMGMKVLDSAHSAAIARGLRIRGVLPKPFKPMQLRKLLRQGSSLPPAEDREAPARSYDAADIQRALQCGELLLHFQPKVDLRSGRVAGFEGLVRWQHPRDGLVGPMHFIPVAEQAGLIDELTQGIVELGLRWVAENRVPEDVHLALNLSASNLHDVQLADRIEKCCRAFGVDPARLVLELTETSAMSDPASAFDTLTRLRIKGFALAIDDFGTGFSSMVQLARLPFSWIKIDKSFVASMAASAESRKIVEAIIYLAKGLGLTTVAEGIEDPAALRMLRKLGCNHGQGFHLARPMPGADAVAWLSHAGAG